MSASNKTKYLSLRGRVLPTVAIPRILKRRRQKDSATVRERRDCRVDPSTGLLAMTGGFGLLEIVISSAILAVGILGLLSAFPRGVSIEKNLEHVTVANQLAQMQMEAFANLHYDELVPGTLESNVRVDADPASPFYDFFRTTVISLVDQNGSASAEDVGLKKLSVTVSWGSVFGGAARSVNLITLASER